MTAYIIVSILLYLCFAVMTAARRKHSELTKPLMLADVAVSVVGICLSLVSYLLMTRVDSTLDTDFIDWTRDMTDMFFKIDIPLFTVLACCLFIPAFLAWFEKKNRTGFSLVIRQAASVFAPAFILIFGGFYSMITQNTMTATDTYIRLFTIGEALVFRMINAVEYRSYLLESENVKKQ